MNAIYDDKGLLGYQCWTCREVFDSMLGETCNRCRQQDELLALKRREVAALEALSRREPKDEQSTDSVPR